MIRRSEASARYTLHYEWPSDVRDAVARKPLIADSLEDAKFEAAILFAGANTPVPPQAYRIVRGARRTVYRFPEESPRRR